MRWSKKKIEELSSERNFKKDYLEKKYGISINSIEKKYISLKGFNFKTAKILIDLKNDLLKLKVLKPSPGMN